MKHKIKAALRTAGDDGVSVDELRRAVVAQVEGVEGPVVEAAFNAKVRLMLPTHVRNVASGTCGSQHGVPMLDSCCQ